MSPYSTPGVYRQEYLTRPVADLQTGIPAFLGFARPDDQLSANAPLATPWPITLWAEFVDTFGSGLLQSDSYLAYAVRGFFENGGRLCYVSLLPLANPAEAPSVLAAGLAGLGSLDAVDLVCAPDCLRPLVAGAAVDLGLARVLQSAVLDHCDRSGDRLAVLDGWRIQSVESILEQRAGLSGDNGALYYPWLTVADLQGQSTASVPPCGHVVGIYSRCDARVGVFKAPANEEVVGALDLSAQVTNVEQDRLNPVGVNCLRSFPSRGIRVWGARTLSVQSAWTYVPVRRLFLTVGRWIERNTADVVFEPNEQRLWARLQRQLRGYLLGLYQRGALQGSTADEAFFVKCDADTNPESEREAGRVVAEIGLAATRPSEFVVVRVTRDASGITIAGPTSPGVA